MDIQKMLYIKKLKENDFNITKASQELYISQPALSKIISNIEKACDVDIFVRNKGKITGFTHIGEIFFADCLKIIDQYEEMSNRLHNLRQKQSKSITIAASPILESIYMQSIMEPLQNKFPDTNFSFVEANSNESIDGLLSHKYNFVIMAVSEDFDIPELTSYMIRSSRFSAYFNINHPLNSKTSINLSDIAKYPITILPEDFSPSGIVTNHLVNNNLSPVILMKNSSWKIQTASLLRGDTISILPKCIKHLLTDAMRTKIVRKRINHSPPWYVKLFENANSLQDETEIEVRSFILEFLKGDFTPPDFYSQG